MGCLLSWCRDQCVDGVRLENETELNRNTLFYSNAIKSAPDGDFIDNIHKYWIGEHRKLEQHHGYIQWLFPLPTPSNNNPRAQPLQETEIHWFRDHPEARRRLILSYQLMLDFYGIELRDQQSGELKRSADWQCRFKNLIQNPHNDRRITRIISCMCFLGCEDLMTSFVHFLVTEVYQEQTLARCRNSCDSHWIPALPLDSRQQMWQYVANFRQV